MNLLQRNFLESAKKLYNPIIAKCDKYANIANRDTLNMHIITYSRIIEAIQKWPQSESALDGWYRVMKANNPSDFAEMKSLFPAVDKVAKFHVFDIGGNKIRLIAVVMYGAKRVYIRHILSHSEYDRNRWKED